MRRYSIEGNSASAIAAELESAIRRGGIASGERLPTVRRLAEQLGVSPATVSSAFGKLRARGLIVGRGRGGARAAGHPPLPARPGLSVPAGARDLTVANPDPALLPSLERALGAVDRRPHLYGEPRNLPELMEIAVQSFGADGIHVRSVVVAGGALDGLERVLQAHLRVGDRVAVEDPGWTNVLDLVRALGLEPVPVSVDDHGLVTESLERALHTGVQAVIVTPRGQNPFGAALGTRRVKELRRVLGSHPTVLLVEDDYAPWVAGAPTLTLTRGRDRWAIIRSVSKALGPDLRLAMIAGDAETCARVERRQFVGTGWVSHILQRLAASLLSDPEVEQLLVRAGDTYAERRKALIDSLHGHGVQTHGRSGLSVWVPVREEAATLQSLLEAGWAVAPGERFRLRTPPALRITITTLEPKDAVRLGRDLAAALAPRRAAYSV